MHSRRQLFPYKSVQDKDGNEEQNVMAVSFMQSYMQLLPQLGESGNIVFWEQEVLN